MNQRQAVQKLRAMLTDDDLALRPEEQQAIRIVLDMLDQLGLYSGQAE